jgi:hypothetical protein
MGKLREAAEEQGSMAMGLSDRILTATAAVLFCLALLWVYSSIESFAEDSNVQSPSTLVLPTWVTNDEQTTKKLSDHDPPTPALVSNESSPSEPTETVIDPSTSELMEAAYTDLIAVQEPKKLDEAPKRHDPFTGALSNPAGLPADYPVLPKVESPSMEPPSSGNAITSFQEDPAQGSTDQATGVTGQPGPAQTPPPNTPEVAQASPQPPLVPPTGTETPTQSPHALPAGAGTPSQPLTPPDASTPSGLP